MTSSKSLGLLSELFMSILSINLPFLAITSDFAVPILAHHFVRSATRCFCVVFFGRELIFKTGTDFA